MTGSEQLLAAAEKGDLPGIKAAIAAGANDLNGALKYAGYNGSIEMLEYLISKGAYNLNGALATAIDGNSEKAMTFLLKNGADDFKGALIKAGRKGHIAITVDMIERCSNLIAKDPSGKNVFDYAKSKGQEEIYKHIFKLLKFSKEKI